MNYSEVTLLFEHSPAIRLLRRRENAPLIVAFLFSAFKGTSVTGPRPLLTVTDELEAYLRHLGDGGVDVAASKTPTVMLREWAGDEVGLIRIWHDEDSRDAQIELTAEAERLLTWLQTFVRKEHVGVESKIKEIWRDVQAIVEMATDNPDVRLQQLDRQIAELEKQRDAIREHGRFERAGERAINEAYARLSAKVRELPGDFREVEDQLRRIAREIGTRALVPDANRGDLVGYAVDAHEELATSPQGQSVDGFLDFLRPPHLQDEFIELVDLVYDVRELSPESRSDSSLRSVFSLLAREARRVQRSRQRLVGVLRSVLDAHRRKESRAVMETLRECLQIVHAGTDRLYADGFEAVIRTDVMINAAMSRGLWQAPRAANLGDIPTDDIPTDPDALRALIAIQAINLEELAQNIRDTLARQTYATLGDVLRDHPPRTGVVEVLGYILLALTHTAIGAVVDDEKHEIVAIGEPPDMRRLRCPSILFAAQ